MYGVLFTIISALALNFVVLQVLYNFVVNKKNKKFAIWLTIIISLVVCGIGIGLICIGLTSFNYNEDANYLTEELSDIEVTDELNVWYMSSELSGNDVKLIETSSDTIKIVIEHSKNSYATIKLHEDINTLAIGYYYSPTNSMEIFQEFLNDLKMKTIRNYNNPKMYIYGSREKLEKIKL